MLNFDKTYRTFNYNTVHDRIRETIFNIEDILGNSDIIEHAKDMLKLLCDQPISIVYFDESSITVRNPLIEFKVSALPSLDSFNTVETRERALYKQNAECIIKSATYRGSLVSMRESTITEEDSEVNYINTEVREDKIFEGESLIYFHSKKSLQETNLDKQRKVSEGLISYSDGTQVIKKVYTCKNDNGSFTQSSKFKKSSLDSMLSPEGEEIGIEEFREALVEYKDNIGQEKFGIIMKKVN